MTDRPPVRMSRAAWDALDPAMRQVRGGHRYVVDPATGGAPVRVRLREYTPETAAPPRRPTAAEVAALLAALTRGLS